MEYLNAFLCGGILCAVGQIIIDKTQLTPARILTGYVVVGVLLSALGLYEPLAQWGGAGATVPLTGFGHTLAKGVREAVASDGWIGIFTGGLTAAAGGVTAAVVAGVLMAAIFRPGEKREGNRGRRGVRARRRIKFWVQPPPAHGRNHFPPHLCKTCPSPMAGRFCALGLQL